MKTMKTKRFGKFCGKKYAEIFSISRWRNAQFSACLCALFLFVADAANAAPAKSAPTPAAVVARQTFESFRMIQSRNIFDPSRQPIRPASTYQSQTSAPVARTDYAALTGTLVTEDKQLAFFSGSRADFNKVLPVNSTIAGFKITRITTSEVEVDRGDGKKSVVPIGQTLPISGPSTAAPQSTQQPFEAGADAASPANSVNSVNPANPAAAASPANSSSSSRDELIKRKMQRRQQETSK